MERQAEQIDLISDNIQLTGTGTGNREASYHERIFDSPVLNMRCERGRARLSSFERPEPIPQAAIPEVVDAITHSETTTLESPSTSLSPLFRTRHFIYWRKRRGRSATCCWATATTLTGTESNFGQVSNGNPRGLYHTYADALKEILGVLVNVQLAGLAVLAEVEGRHFGDVLILALTLLFLQLEGDTTDGSALDTLHPIEELGLDKIRYRHVAHQNRNPYKWVAYPAI